MAQAVTQTAQDSATITRNSDVTIPTIAIYSITEQEFGAVLDRLRNSHEFRGQSHQRYMIEDMTTPRGPLRVAAFRGPLQTNNESQQNVARAILDLHPSWVLVVGTAGGVPHKDFTIGDVVIANEILDFSYEVKQDEKAPELHKRTLQLHSEARAIVAMLPAILRQISHWSSEQETQHQRPAPPKQDNIKSNVPEEYIPRLASAIESHLKTPRSLPIALAGTIGSSNGLQKSVGFLYQVIEGNRFLLCNEMESTGAHAACNTNAEAPIPLLTIRGISDITGIERAEEWTTYACNTAASLALNLIRSGALLPPPGEPTQSFHTVKPIPSNIPRNPLAGNNDIENNTHKLALRNILRFGDTDIFPRPIEIGAFRDNSDETVSLLNKIDQDFDDYFPRYPPSNLATLSQVGTAGFRWASQLDPLYNAYLLSLVLRLASHIERIRIPVSKKVVFSYRLNPDHATGRLFSDEESWDAFNGETRRLAEGHAWVIKTDIADFYARVPHEKLRTTLESMQRGSQYNDRILAMLSEYSRNSGIGLPVGGPASRILAECYLSYSDHVLRAKGLEFCRFADDYVLFANSERQATTVLSELAQTLSEHEGLSLQKLKTRVMRKSEYIRSYNFDPNMEVDKDSVSFLSLRIKYDPYSATATEDYETLRRHLSNFDILGMLAREMKKTRLHHQLTKKLLYAARYIEDRDVDSAIISIAENLRTLLPLFFSVSSLLSSLVQRGEADSRALVKRRLIQLLSDDGSPDPLALHRMIAIRLLSSLGDDSSETSDVLWREYSASDTPLVSKECIWGLFRLSNSSLIKALLAKFESSSPWDRRALIAASHVLGGEGEAFRQRMAPRFAPFESLIASWCEARNGLIFAERSDDL